MNLKERILYYKNIFLTLNDESSQCEYLLLKGFEKKTLEYIRTDFYRIEGCQTAIWLSILSQHQFVNFSSDSDSVLVRGILSIYEELYLGQSFQTILDYPPVFLDLISDKVIYPEIKHNGLIKCYQSLTKIQ